MKVTKIKTLTIPCGWRSCKTRTENEWQMHDHISSHLNEWDVEEEDYTCPWKDCSFQSTEIGEMHRHLYYHGYYSGLLVRGKYECDLDPTVPKCRMAKGEHKFPDFTRAFQCQWVDCERKFDSIIEFQDHVVRHTTFEYDVQKTPDDKRQTIKCYWNFCKMLLKTKYRFKEHISTHTNKKLMACRQCGEVFRTRTTLFDHLRRQPANNTYKYQCTQCYKYFATEKLLRTHVVKHVNCFKCTLCDMTCASSNALATHVRYRHLTDRPFSCPYCDHRSVRRSDMKAHISYKHVKTEYTCNKSGCSYTVRSHNLLRRHLLEVHGNNPFLYMCHCCEKIFRTGKSLSSHLIKKHDYQHPSGHKRFTYRIDEVGFLRLETRRIQSLEVIEQLMSTEKSDIMDNDHKKKPEIITINNYDVPKDIKKKNNAGEVYISLPEVEKIQKFEQNWQDGVYES